MGLLGCANGVSTRAVRGLVSAMMLVVADTVEEGLRGCGAA